MSSIIIGVDPGLDGGIARIRAGVGGVSAIPMPTIGTGRRKEYLPALVCELRFLDDAPVYMFIEKAQPYPKQGVTSVFTYGRHYGIWIGICAALEIPLEEVTPRAWQKVMLGSRTGDTKARSVECAARMFPRVSLMRTGRCSKPHDGMADALLIAEFGRRSLMGERGASDDV